MSLRTIVKLLRSIGLLTILTFALPSLGYAQQFGTPTCAGSDCGHSCQTHHCPPAFKYCFEGPPHIHWKCGCPHPICNPCDLPHFGYFEPCWSPWPFPANLAHCPTPPPASFINLSPYVNPPAPAPRTPGMLPTPGVVPAPGAPPINPPLPSSNDELQQPRQLQTPR
jgi:hypothetical protein